MTPERLDEITWRAERAVGLGLNSEAQQDMLDLCAALREAWRRIEELEAHHGKIVG